MKLNEWNFGRSIGKCLLTAAVALMLVPSTGLTVHAVDAGGGETSEYSKTISATNLDKDFKSEVTISLPSKEEQLSSEVCFVLDKSQFSNTKGPALQMLDELKKAADESGAKVKVDVVGFNRTAIFPGSFDLAKDYDGITSAFDTDAHGGTNMHAGLLKAQEVLASDSSIPDHRKYMILVSDGDTYLYCKNGHYNTPYSRSYIPVQNARDTAYGGYYDESRYKPSAGYEDQVTGKKNVKRPTTSSQSDWESYLEDVAARNQESNGDRYDFEWKYYDKGWDQKSADEVAADGFKTQPAVPRSASNLDMGFYYAAKTYHELASKYHCYAMAVPSWNTADGGHSAFMDYMNNGAVSGFENIKNEILYFLGNGTTVQENIGYVKDDYNFDLSDPSTMILRIDNSNGEAVTSYTAVQIEENHFGFGDKKEDGTYSYEVIYTPGEKKDDEQFVWKINVPVTNFQRLNLIYKVKLMNPKTAAGTYGEYDADGSLGKTGLFVSNSAFLTPVDSAGTSNPSQEFAKPTVSYSVKAAPTPTPSATTTPGGYDDGSPFTKDACGNVFDRWGNQIWTSPNCVSSGLKSVPKTSASD